jgi:hypothetical protein
LSKIGVEHQVMDVQSREISFHSEKKKKKFLQAK